ncbi:MAG: glycosyltransferase family 4 protein, partial [bacterium]
MNLLIVTGIFPPDVGGPATYVPRIANVLNDRGWNVEVITAGHTEADLEFPYPVHRVPRSAPGRYRESVPTIIDRAGWADRLYVNGLEMDNYLAGFFHSCPRIQKCVGDRSWERYRNSGRGELDIDEFQECNPDFRTWLERSIHRHVTRGSDEFIVPSHYLKSILAKWGIPTEDITVIYNHSHPPQSIPDEPISWPGSDLKMLSVGRLVPWKRVPQLIKRLPNLPRAGLVVLGDGPERSRCRKTINRASVAGRVELKGNVDRPVVWQHLREADLLVLNSTYEGFPHIL